MVDIKKVTRVDIVHVLYVYQIENHLILLVAGVPHIAQQARSSAFVKPYISLVTHPSLQNSLRGHIVRNELTSIQWKNDRGENEADITTHLRGIEKARILKRRL